MIYSSLLRLVGAVSIVAAAIGLTACGSDSSSSNATDSPAVTATSTTTVAAKLTGSASAKAADILTSANRPLI